MVWDQRQEDLLAAQLLTIPLGNSLRRGNKPGTLGNNTSSFLESDLVEHKVVPFQ
jgi:hypothetical protein